MGSAFAHFVGSGGVWGKIYENPRKTSLKLASLSLTYRGGLEAQVFANLFQQHNELFDGLMGQWLSGSAAAASGFFVCFFLNFWIV